MEFRQASAPAAHHSLKYSPPNEAHRLTLLHHHPGDTSLIPNSISVLKIKILFCHLAQALEASLLSSPLQNPKPFSSLPLSSFSNPSTTTFAIPDLHQQPSLIYRSRFEIPKGFDGCCSNLSLFRRWCRISASIFSLHASVSISISSFNGGFDLSR